MLNKSNKKLPTVCPSCQNKLNVKKLFCNSCNTEVDGNYEMPAIMSLTGEDHEFILNFILSSGSLKEMAKLMDRSYPLVRNKLDDIINKLKSVQNA